MDIAKQEGINLWHARRCLDAINKEARDSLLSTLVAERVPLAVEVSLETHRILIKKLMYIMNNSKDERCQMQAAAQIASINNQTNDILSMSDRLAHRIQRVLVVHPLATKSDDAEADEDELAEEPSSEEEGGQLNASSNNLETVNK